MMMNEFMAYNCHYEYAMILGFLFLAKHGTCGQGTRIEYGDSVCATIMEYDC